MALVLHNPTVAELVRAIALEDAGLTPKVTAKTIAKLPEPKTHIVGTEVVAMQMAVSQCNKYANLLG